jgi:hypothetical protein
MGGKVMKDEIMNRAIETYIEKLESENSRAKQIFSEINKAIGFDGSKPNRTDEDKYREILDILKCYGLDENC